jgi:nucleotide-binding universal stress UspA family protein
LRHIKTFGVIPKKASCPEEYQGLLTGPDMSFATMMVHVDVDPPSDARIRLAARLAARFQATLIGACAWEPRPPLTYGGVVVDAKITEDMLRGMSARLDQAGEHFRTLVEPDQPVEWRSAIDSPTEFVIKQARAADLLIVSRDRMAGCSLDPGAVVLKAGRPLLAVPPDIQSLIAERVVIGWKDTREARRAVRDSLPLLREASNVAITIGSVAGELLRVAGQQKADLIVAGAYGHNRLGEWLFWRRHRRAVPREPGVLSAVTLTKLHVFSRRSKASRATTRRSVSPILACGSVDGPGEFCTGELCGYPVSPGRSHGTAAS